MVLIDKFPQSKAYFFTYISYILLEVMFLKEVIFKGCATALVTPFTEDGVNFEELRKLIEFQILEEVDGLVICGTTGESSTMSLEEKKNVIDFAVKVANKRVPIIAGTGGNNTKEAVLLSKYAEKVGADALLIVTPYYNKTTQKGLIFHYKEIAQNTSLPIILYNVPSRTGLNIEPNTCLELSKISNIVAIKEASGNISQVAKIANSCRDNLTIYSGNDDQTVPILSLGGLGVISVLSNIFPKFVHNMVYDYLCGNWQKSCASQLYSLPLTNALFSEVNPIPVKYAMSKIGFNCGKPRLPLVEFSDENKEKLNKLISEFNV